MNKILYERIVNLALSEDLSWGDITTDILIDPGLSRIAYIKAKAVGILAGTEIARYVFQKVDRELKVYIYMRDGTKLNPGDRIIKIEGSVSSILKAERVALNFLQHLSGIASQTSVFVEIVKDLPVKIADTRKTIPGLRNLEKQAVLSGGGINHRHNLGDCILIKSNHLSVLKKSGVGIKEIIGRAQQQNCLIKKPVEIEVKTVKEALEASIAKADIIMLDNMKLEDMRKTVSLIKGKAIIEASGGINIENVRKVAEAGVDAISIGALTHSAKALDISLSLE